MFFVEDVSANEGSSGITTFTFRVALVPAQTSCGHVNYATAPGTAEEESDFIPTSGTLEFGPGDRFATFDVLVIADQHIELNEVFYAELGDPSVGVITGGSGTGTIINDDLVEGRRSLRRARPLVPNTPTRTRTPSRTATATATPACLRYQFSLSANEEVPPSGPMEPAAPSSRSIRPRIGWITTSPSAT
jgi:hypothetical protein